MAVIKLKQGDIERIVKTIVSEQFPGEKEEMPVDDVQASDNQSGIELTMMVDPNGKYYAVDMSNPANPRVVATSK
jgi:hypothetical protein